MPPPQHQRPHKHHIRPATTHPQNKDSALILAFTDSQLPHLARVGSSEQWGTKPVSTDPAKQEKYQKLVSRSESPQNTWGKDWIQISILEIEIEGGVEGLPEGIRDLATTNNITTTADTGDDNDEAGPPSSSSPHRLPIAALILSGQSPDYTRPVIPEQDSADPFLYLQFLVTDRRVGDLSRGAGGILLEFADGVARALGVGRVVLDGWKGGGGGLVG